MQNSFRPYKGKWITKEYVMAASSVAVEKGDLMEISDSDAPTVDLGTNNADAIVGIAAQDLTAAQTASTIAIKVFVPAEPKCEMIGRITDGVAVVGTDINRMADLEDHEGIDVDTKTHGHVYIVRITVATADGSVTAGEGIFRIANTPQTMDAAGWSRA